MPPRPHAGLARITYSSSDLCIAAEPAALADLTCFGFVYSQKLTRLKTRICSCPDRINSSRGALALDLLVLRRRVSGPWPRVGTDDDDDDHDGDDEEEEDDDDDHPEDDAEDSEGNDHKIYNDHGDRILEVVRTM